MLETITDGEKIYINKAKYFIIFDYDLRIYKNNTLLTEINTYPNNPRDIFKIIKYIH